MFMDIRNDRANKLQQGENGGEREWEQMGEAMGETMDETMDDNASSTKDKLSQMAQSSARIGIALCGSCVAN